MAHAYLGIINSRGLEMLVPETEHAMPFLLRRAYRCRPHQAVCCWAVLPEQAAYRVRCLVASGQLLQALIALNVEAQELGTIPPDYADVDALPTSAR